MLKQCEGLFMKSMSINKKKITKGHKNTRIKVSKYREEAKNRLVKFGSTFGQMKPK